MLEDPLEFHRIIGMSLKWKVRFGEIIESLKALLSSTLWQHVATRGNHGKSSLFSDFCHPGTGDQLVPCPRVVEALGVGT